MTAEEIEQFARSLDLFSLKYSAISRWEATAWPHLGGGYVTAEGKTLPECVSNLRRRVTALLAAG